MASVRNTLIHRVSVQHVESVISNGVSIPGDSIRILRLANVFEAMFNSAFNVESRRVEEGPPDETHYSLTEKGATLEPVFDAIDE